MKLLIIIGIVIALASHFKHDIERLFATGAFDENGEPKAILFVQDKCGSSNPSPCELAQQYLDSHNIDYEMLDPYSSPELIQKYKIPSTIPYLVVGYDKVYEFSRGLYSSVLATNFGHDVLNSTEANIYSQHFDENGKPQIVLYGTTWCGYCNRLRADFDANDVDFVDIDVEKPVEKTWLIKAMGIRGYPTVYVGYQRVNGFDYKAVMAAR